MRKISPSRRLPVLDARSLGGMHAAADDLRRITSSLAGCLRPPGANSISSFSSNDSLGRPHLHSPSLACRVFHIKKPYSCTKQPLFTLPETVPAPFSERWSTGPA